MALLSLEFVFTFQVKTTGHHFDLNETCLMRCSALATRCFSTKGGFGLWIRLHSDRFYFSEIVIRELQAKYRRPGCETLHLGNKNVAPSVAPQSFGPLVGDDTHFRKPAVKLTR